MRIWMAAIAVLALGAGTAQAQNCGLKQYDSLPMEVSPERLLLPVTFGTVPKKMVFRLDSAANGIAADSAEALDMRFTSMPPHLIFHRDGREITRIAHAPEVHLGRMTLKSMEFLVFPPKGHPDEVVGDIGTHMFENTDLEPTLTAENSTCFRPTIAPARRCIGPRPALRRCR
jgi:hypothetical protein